MKIFGKRLAALLVGCLWLNCSAEAQSRTKIDAATDEILREGLALYQSERASWVGTDMLMAGQPDMSQLGGYLSYADGDSVRCVFFRRKTADEPLQIQYTFSFPRQQIETTTGRSVSRIRPATAGEQRLFTVRQRVFTEFRTHEKLGEPYRQPDDTNFNVALLDNGAEIRAYVLTGPKKDPVLPIGNDYLLTFNSAGELQRAEKLHNSYLPFDRASLPENAQTAFHTHLEGHPYITPTDICSALLYQNIVPFPQMIVSSKKYVSLFNIKDQQLVILTQQAWSKIAKASTNFKQ